ncbi:MAG: hypothetical protein U0236_07880 [Nitrospira sp.]
MKRRRSISSWVEKKSAQGRYDEAKDAYLAVLKIDPQNSEAAQFVESLKQGGNGSAKTVKPTASASTQKFTPTQKPTEPVDLLAEAVRRIMEKQYNGAEAILNQLLTREPGNPQVCQLLARLHLQREMYKSRSENIAFWPARRCGPAIWILRNH